MSDTFTLRVGDRLPRLAYKFGFSLQDATAVTFSAYDAATKQTFIDRQAAIIANGTYTVNGQSVTYTLADGVVFYPWAAPDVAVERLACRGLFRITWPGGLQETQPQVGSYIDFAIGENF